MGHNDQVRTSRSISVADAESRYVVQHDRVCNLVEGQMGMRVYFEPRDKPYWLTVKVFEANGSARVTASIREMERMSDEEIVAGVLARLRSR